MSENIYFSVIICCYNSEKYISETIDSIINQTYDNWEIIAINDGSTDNTEKIIFGYIDQGVPITYHYQKNKGFASARNKAIELAKGDWIAIIDHDDICLPKRLDIQAKQIRENPNAKLFLANTIHFKDEGFEIGRQFDSFNPCKSDLTAIKAMNMLLKKQFIDSESVIFEKRAALDIGGLNTSYQVSADHDFFLRIGAKYDFFASEETVSKFRVHAEQATQQRAKVHYRESMEISYIYFRHKDVTFFTKIAIINLMLKMNIIKVLKLILIKFGVLSGQGPLKYKVLNKISNLFRGENNK